MAGKTSTKEAVQKAAMTSFKTVQLSVGTTLVELRELSHAERKELLARIYVSDANGEPILFDKDGKQDPKGDMYHFNEGANPTEEWIAACITPQFTVEEIKPWYNSTKNELLEAAKKINNIEAASTVAKNS